MNIIEFKKTETPEEIKETTIAGEAQCILCKHKWIAVAPAGAVWLECPECKSMKGHYIFHCFRENTPHWTCNCGNNLFFIIEKGIYCSNCGTWQQPY